MNEKDKVNAIKLMPQIVKHEIAGNKQLSQGIAQVDKVNQARAKQQTPIASLLSSDHFQKEPC